jgi:hypothetical protein
MLVSMPAAGKVGAAGAVDFGVAMGMVFALLVVVFTCGLGLVLTVGAGAGTDVGLTVTGVGAGAVAGGVTWIVLSAVAIICPVVDAAVSAMLAAGATDTVATVLASGALGMGRVTTFVGCATCAKILPANKQVVETTLIFFNNCDKNGLATVNSLLICELLC